jgi:hypothetical protein
MANGSGINIAGTTIDSYCKDNGGYPSTNGIIGIPGFPTSSNMNYLFHFRRKVTLMRELLYTTIDMDKEAGAGAVIQKNQVIFQDTFASPMTAIRHGNGRDWWIICYKNRGNRHYVFLFDSNGPHSPLVQNIGKMWNEKSWSGQSTFSPNGQLFVRASPYNGVDVFDFDRCTGELSNPRILPIDASVVASGVSFSPNSQYLYLSTGLQLYQYDINAADIKSSRQLIGTYDGFGTPFSTNFYTMRLAPNNKIYMTSTNGTNYLHTIHRPNEWGEACDFRQHDLELPAYQGDALPNFPNFRLYDFTNSPCDTLGINGPIVGTPNINTHSIEVYIEPNPAISDFFVRFKAPFTGILVLYNNIGQSIIKQSVIATENYHFVTETLPNGVYFLKVINEKTGMSRNKQVMLINH